MLHAHLICFCALSVYYIKNIYGQYVGGLPYPHLNDQCSKMPLMLNDCNWCKCQTLMYQCQVRNCKGNSDPFGHVNDALKEIAVGMEGHGFWRSYNTHCAANAQYQRGNLLCICDNRGEWPSSACRDAFRILYPIEQLVQELRPGDACSINKLYLIGCNVCICPADGQINKDYCTKRECSTLDKSINVKDSNFNPRNYTIDEIYAKCDKGVKLLVEGKECECYSGNRIICKDEDEPLGDNAEASVEIGGSIKIDLVQIQNDELNKEINKLKENENNNTTESEKITESDKTTETHTTTQGDKTTESDKTAESDKIKQSEETKESSKTKGNETKAKDIIATVLFVKPPFTGICPRNEFVKVGCNYCFCMIDGNGVCTTFKCSRK